MASSSSSHDTGGTPTDSSLFGAFAEMTIWPKSSGGFQALSSDNGTLQYTTNALEIAGVSSLLQLLGTDTTGTLFLAQCAGVKEPTLLKIGRTTYNIYREVLSRLEFDQTSFFSLRSALFPEFALSPEEMSAWETLVALNDDRIRLFGSSGMCIMIMSIPGTLLPTLGLKSTIGAPVSHSDLDTEFLGAKKDKSLASGKNSLAPTPTPGRVQQVGPAAKTDESAESTRKNFAAYLDPSTSWQSELASYFLAVRSGAVDPPACHGLDCALFRSTGVRLDFCWRHIRQAFFVDYLGYSAPPPYLASLHPTPKYVNEFMVEVHRALRDHEDIKPWALTAVIIDHAAATCKCKAIKISFRNRVEDP